MLKYIILIISFSNCLQALEHKGFVLKNEHFMFKHVEKDIEKKFDSPTDLNISIAQIVKREPQIVKREPQIAKKMANLLGITTDSLFVSEYKLVEGISENGWCWCIVWTALPNQKQLGGTIGKLPSEVFLYILQDGEVVYPKRRP